MDSQRFFVNFIKKGKFEFENLNRTKAVLCIKDNILIKKTFELLIDQVNRFDDKNNDTSIIINCVELLNIVCDDATFSSDEVLVNRKRIKKAREALLSKYNKYKDEDLLESANKLDEIILDKKMATNDLRMLIKKLIEKKEDVNIIKKLLNTNKGVLLLYNNELFDYAFDFAMNSLSEGNGDIFYYIVLLKILYTSKINKTECLKKLNSVCDETNEFGNEIYQIIHGNKRYLTTDQLFKKYSILTDLNSTNIIAPNNKPTDDFILTIDSEGAGVRDDAISIKKDGDLNIIKIYITDPTSFIEHNGIIDVQARNNYSTIYLPGSNLKMLSDSIQSSLSLDKGKDRKVLALTVTMDNEGSILDYTLKEDVINVNENLSFDYADTLLKKQKGDLAQKVEQLYEVSLLLQKANPKKYKYWAKKENDSIDKVVVDHKSQKIINELMVLYNYLLAEIAAYDNIPYVYKTNTPSYIDNLVEKMNINIEKDAKFVLSSIYLKSKFSSLPIFHYGLNLPYYSRSTSPLRDYPSLYNQYLLHTFYFNDLYGTFREDLHEDIIEYFNKRSIELSLMASEYSRALKIKKD